MSYNISSWKVKKIKELKIPVSSFFEVERKDWCPDKSYNEQGELTLECGEASFIRGFVKDGIIEVNDICMCGECSGTFVNMILEPALKKSSGSLEVSCVWEGGERINKLIVDNGKVNWEEIEI